MSLLYFIEDMIFVNIRPRLIMKEVSEKKNLRQASTLALLLCLSLSLPFYLEPGFWHMLLGFIITSISLSVYVASCHFYSRFVGGAGEIKSTYCVISYSLSPLILVAPLAFILEYSIIALPELLLISLSLLVTAYFSTLMYSILIASIGLSVAYKMAIYRSITVVVSGFLTASLAAVTLSTIIW